MASPRPSNIPPIWDNQDLILYHGTIMNYANAILRDGIDVGKGRPFTDFGRGFYTTTSLAQAKKWAVRLAQRKQNSAAILQLSATRNDLANLETLWFTGTGVDLENYWSFVFHCRQNDSTHERNGSMLYYDCVVGPLAAKWQERVLYDDADQISFHNERAVRILRLNPKILEI